ncbi:MAG: enoyl-CoA hydratase/isomerase family protein [Clostridiales Family XIII bacterium]|jgi:enoyl-CoA hydratase|nr:enoyl-CoA hydratase/isomerase family protein [Clostridiales Family XIII bacterium]
MTDFSTLKFEIADGVAVITIDRSEALNALNESVLGDLDAVFHQVAADENVRVVIVTGAGKAFVAGADIVAMSELSQDECRLFMKTGQEVFHYIEEFPVPVIAAINGFALGGGCELAMACDVRIASEKAKFGQPEVGLGILPGFGGTQRLARLVGPGYAKYLVFGAQTIDAAEALRIGLVQKVVAAETLMDEVMGYARAVAKNGPVAVRAAKEVIAKGADTDVRAGCGYELDAQVQTFGSSDHIEGLKAFTEKRKPEFLNK